MGNHRENKWGEKFKTTITYLNRPNGGKNTNKKRNSRPNSSRIQLKLFIEPLLLQISKI